MALPKKGPVVAIDGPAGTGKSSVTRRLAEQLHFVHIDTGALYRAIAFLTLERKSRFPHEEEGEIAVHLARSAHLEFKRMPGLNPVNRIFANSRDLTDLIRSPGVSMASSRISAIAGVRAALLGIQRRLGAEGRAILEGRDIGSVVFPDAEVKFYLTASVEERAKRRLIEMEASGVDVPTFEEVKADIQQRDLNDMNRSVAPLKKAEGAVEMDTSDLTLDQVVAAMEKIVRHRIFG
ncbi:MAG: (d)CMP kinase [Bdellovibrionia bacterium]